MPAQRPRASFEPISPEFDVRSLVETTENFQYVDRISYETIQQQGIDQFEKLVLLHVILGGKPLVIDGFEDVLDPWTFTPRWLRDNHGTKVENARNLATKETIPLTIGHYLKNMGRLTDQYFDKPTNYRDKNRQRIYLKDIDCPPVWEDKLKEHIPASLFYLNESTGEIGGLGAVNERIQGANGKRKGRGIGRAGDLMSSLPPEMRADNLMCYIGHEGTYTPTHREMCASLGQNIMVDASGTVGEDGSPEKPGSSIWFMTETKDRHLVSEYWLSVLGHDIEIEDHFAQIVAWKRAPFRTYVVEQRPGDFLLIPPLAPHQVWNRGTRTMKIAWNRTTVETLEMAFSEAIHRARMVCRDEQYKNKAIVYYTLEKYAVRLNTANAQADLGSDLADRLRRAPKIRQVQKDFKRLLELYKKILLSEMFALDGPHENCEYLAFDSNVTCAYCRGNIFNRFLTCKSCPRALGTDTDEPYDICMECYAMGRSCACISGLKWAEQWKWKDLLQKYEDWRTTVMEIDGGVTEQTPLSLTEERRYLGKKTLAQICQEQLKLRPWVDITKSRDQVEESDEEIKVNDDGTVKKTVKKRSKAWLASHKTCHVCCNRHPRWKMTPCTNCDLWWCYGTLFRAHDLMPQTVMEDPNWKCPHCRKVCSTGACRRDPRQTPYEPTGTLLGHDTKKVADVRSVECLVDFGVSNLNWIRETGDVPEDSTRLQRRKQEAQRAKEQRSDLDDHYIDADEDIAMQSEYSGDTYNDTLTFAHEDDTIDPRLGGGSTEGSNISFMNTGQNAVQYPHLAPTSIAGGIQDLSNSSLYVSPLVQQLGSLGTSNTETRFQPHSGVVAPSAVMLQQPPSLYPEPSYVDSASDGPQQKQATQNDGEYIKLVTKKRKRSENDDPTPQSKNGATRRFRQEQEKRKLEEAKKAGRFIQVYGAVKGKSKIVKLSLGQEKLESFQRQQAGHEANPNNTRNTTKAQDANIIIQSDILPKVQALPGTIVPSKNTTQKPPQNQYRYRVENDDDFRTRKDRRRTAANTLGNSKSKVQYEEVTMSSDDESIDETLQNAHTSPPLQKDKRRVSTWLSRRRQDEQLDIPDIATNNIVDDSTQQPAPSSLDSTPHHEFSISQLDGTSSVMQTTAFKPINNPTEATDQEDQMPVSKKSIKPSAKKPQRKPVIIEIEPSPIKPIQSTPSSANEANLKAKLMAAKWAAGEETSQSDSDLDSVDAFVDSILAGDPLPQSPIPHVTEQGPVQNQRSLLSRPELAGKKIRIVAAKSKPDADTKLDVPSSATPAAFEISPASTKSSTGARKFKRISRASKVVQLSNDSDSEEILAPKRVSTLTSITIRARGNRARGNRGRSRKLA